MSISAEVQKFFVKHSVSKIEGTIKLVKVTSIPNNPTTVFGYLAEYKRGSKSVALSVRRILNRETNLHVSVSNSDSETIKLLNRKKSFDFSITNYQQDKPWFMGHEQGGVLPLTWRVLVALEVDKVLLDSTWAQAIKNIGIPIEHFLIDDPRVKLSWQKLRRKLALGYTKFALSEKEVEDAEIFS